MVLESLTSPFKAENEPKKLVFLGFLYSSLAIFLSLWIFRNYSSMIMVFLSVMALVPLLYNIIKMEEEKDLEELGEKWLLKEHWKALRAFTALFIGMVLAFVFWYVVLPSNTISVLFETQTSTISAINSSVTGMATESLSVFARVFLNNIKVLIFCVLFSFV